MIAHSNDFKNEIAKMGRQINAKLIYIVSSTISSEVNLDNIITEDGNEIATERDLRAPLQPQVTIQIPNERIYSIEIIRNGNLLQSLMQQCNFEVSKDVSWLDIGNEFNVKLGVSIEDTYEYIDYGDFILYSKEYNAVNQTWQCICYDRMLWAMKKYARLNISYPITIRNYIQAIADRIGVTFASANEEFTNYDKLIYKDYFVNKNVTYRDILDKLSELTASNIIIKSGQLKVAYPTESNDTIDENYLKDINVNFGKNLNPINKINLIDNENNLYFSYSNNSSIEQYGLKEINITNNPLVFNGQEEEIGQNILDALDDLIYTANDFTTTGVCYYEFLDLFTVSIKDENYKCLLLNNEIKITQGIEETIFTEELENTQTETGDYENISNKDTQSQINQINADKVSRTNVINAINQSKESAVIISSKFILIQNFTGTTDSDGFLDTGIDENYVLISATAQFNNDNYGFIIPYYYYNNGNPLWKLKIENKSKTALANTEINATIYYIRRNN